METVKKMIVFVLGVVLFSVMSLANGNTTPTDNTDTFLINLVWDCAKTEDAAICLKSKAVNFLDKLIRMKEPVQVTDYLVLAKDPTVVEAADNHLNELETEETENLSTDNAEEKNNKLDKIIWNKLSTLYNSRTLQLADTFEGRDKGGKILKKGHGVFLMAAMMGGMMMKMAMGKIALIAGKALVVGKIALILSLILFVRRFLTPANNLANQAEVVYTTADQGRRSWERNYEPHWGADGNSMAYNAHKPTSP